MELRNRRASLEPRGVRKHARRNRSGTRKGAGRDGPRPGRGKRRLRRRPATRVGTSWQHPQNAHARSGAEN